MNSTCETQKGSALEVVSWMPEARQLAVQCWCDPETENREMDVVLAEAVARRIEAWMNTAAMFARNADFYRDLLDKCAEYLGPGVFISDDGSVQQDPLRLKIPELVRELALKASEAYSVQERNAVMAHPVSENE